MEQALDITSFEGGTARNEKKDIQFSARFLKNINLHDDPSHLVPFQEAIKVSGSTVTGLIKWMDDAIPYDTNKYFVDDSGNVYQETSAGAWSQIKAGATIANGGTGQGLIVFRDYLYVSTSTTLARFGPLSGTPAWNYDFLSDGTTNLDQTSALTGQTYSVPTSISEAATARQTFTPAKDPIKTIRIKVATKGTGNWTVTLHDSNNVALGSVTIANASITGSQNNDFTFTTPVRITMGNSYHFHVTSSVADGTVTTGTTADLETVNFSTYFGILIADVDFHPMTEFLNGIAIGNGNYVAYWDEAVYSPNKIELAPGFRVRTQTKDNEFLVSGCWKGTDVDQVEEGRIYYWDGTATTYNYFKPVPMGIPNAIGTDDNRLVGIYGSSGEMFLNSEPFQNINATPKLAKGKKMAVNPGAISNWQRFTMIGFGESTDDTTGVEIGIYSWGSKNESLPEVMTLAHTISTGRTQGTNLKIGAVKGFGKDLYFSWRDASSYGVDKVSKTNDAAAVFAWESLIFDKSNPQKDAHALELVIRFAALPTGVTITPKYKIDRATSWTLGAAESTLNATYVICPIYTRFKEIEFGFDGTSTGAYPIITGIYFGYNDLSDERSFN